jgi:hypothetical protein
MTPTTQKAKVDEIMKCARDPVYFINTYCRIQHPQRGIIPFKTYEFQDDCVRKFVEHRFNIILKSRQLGLSTITAAYSVWLALFHKGKDILVIATKLTTAINFIKKVKVILKSIPKWLCISDYEPTRQEVKFKNGSRVQAIPTSEDAGRSESLSLLIVDEAAFIRNMEDIWAGIYPTLSTGGRAILLSTPNGVGGTYYQLYAGAEAKTNKFVATKLMWWVHPEHDKEWFDSESKQMSRQKIAQELLCEFIGSGDTYVTADDIAYLSSQAKEPSWTGADLTICKSPEERPIYRDLWVWERPVPGTKYILSADVARGDAKDYSTFHIISQTGAMVAEYMGKIPADKFGVLINEVGRYFNNAYVCPENNTYGYTTCQKLVELRYPKIIYQATKLSQVDQFVPSEGDKPGFSTQKNSRELAIAKLEEMIRNRTIKFVSTRLVNELRTFIWNGQKAVAMKDEHDDLVMSAAIGSWIFDAMFGTGTTLMNDHGALFKAMSKSSTNIADVPGSGREVGPIMKAAVSMWSLHRPRLGRPGEDNIANFDWVLK